MRTVRRARAGRRAATRARVLAGFPGRTISGALAILAVSGPVAARADDFQACMARSEGISAAMLDCGAVEITRWDGRLNAAYRTLMRSLPPTARATLQGEQRAWLKHHLAETRRLAGAPDTGSMAFIESQVFELSDLQQRAEGLERRAGLAAPPAGPRPAGASGQPAKNQPREKARRSRP